MKPSAFFISSSAKNRMFDAYDAETLALLRETLALPDEVILPDQLEQRREQLSKANYLFSTWGMPALTEEQIQTYLPNLKAVFYAAGSVQQFARPFLSCGVRVFSAWAANAIPVAEHTVAQIILSGKGMFQSARIYRSQGQAAAQQYSASFPGNYTEKAGILGAGMIGSRVLEMLRGYHIETLTFDPFASDEKLAGLGTKRATLEEIFSQCQTISNHIANLPTTQGMLTYRHFSLMKPNATFINTGRGAQVVEADLIRALQEEPGRTALLDVTWPEPPAADSPLWTMENVVLTPHIAGSMSSEVARMGAYMADEYLRLEKGEPCLYEVSRSMLETMA